MILGVETMPMDLGPAAEMQKVVHVDDTQVHESSEEKGNDMIQTGKPYDPPTTPPDVSPHDPPQKHETTPPDATGTVKPDPPSIRLKKYLEQVGVLWGCGWNSSIQNANYFFFSMLHL